MVSQSRLETVAFGKKKSEEKRLEMHFSVCAICGWSVDTHVECRTAGSSERKSDKVRMHGNEVPCK